MSFYIINSRAEKEPFSWQKVYQSAKRVGASKEIARKTADIVAKELSPNQKTSEIFEKVKKILEQESPQAALRFSLKKAMRKLGPTGFPFEKYVGEIFEQQGFNVKVGQIVKGRCCRHEIDFLAEDKENLFLGECKYRNLPGKRIDLPVALQNYARFLDIENGNFMKKGKELKTILVTNTKFTSQAIKYSTCVGSKLLGWRYPKKQGLEYFIETQKLYPITILPSLTRFLSSIFVEKKMMLVRDILKLDIEKFAKQNRLQLKHLEPLIRETKILLSE